ncbi:MAG: hypothetical protein IJ489_04485 [Clostridia bacterium]|nr:hypothetical protein [Clostridia bacterium]
MNITFRNTNAFDVYLCIDGRPHIVAPYSEEGLSRADTGGMTLAVRIKEESYAEKPKRSFWNFSFYHDYHLMLESVYQFVGVQDGDVFDIVAEEQSMYEPEGVIYNRGAVHPRRSIYFEVTFRVLGDHQALKKQYRKDNFKNGLFDFFLDPLIDVGTDGCSFGCFSTIIFWAIVIGCIVKFGFMAVLKWILVIYLAFAVLEWSIKALMDYISNGGKTKNQAFAQCFAPDFIKTKFETYDFGTKKKKGFFGKK